MQSVADLVNVMPAALTFFLDFSLVPTDLVNVMSAALTFFSQFFFSWTHFALVDLGAEVN